jgi:putative membrane protein
MGRAAKELKLYIFLLLSLLAILIWSFIDCFDLLTWFMEAFPVIAGAAVLISIYHKFRFTTLSLVLIWLHAIVLLVGAHYTYARVPLFDWIRDFFELSRNHYDRLGHFAQGFVPAILAREILLRKSPLRKGGWLFFILICFCLALSAAYELLEWLAAVILEDASEAFLGTQGDVWDTQKDMAWCLVGSLVSLLTLRKLHDKAMEKTF